MTESEFSSIPSVAATPADRSAEQTGQHSRPQRLYSYSRNYSRGNATVNAWYYPGADPYGKYPFEIEFLFVTLDGTVLREYTIYEADAESQSTTVVSAVTDINVFFATKLALNLENTTSLLGPPEDDADDDTDVEEDEGADDDESSEGGRRRRIIRGI